MTEELSVEDVREVLNPANHYENGGRGVRVSHTLGFPSNEIRALANRPWKVRVTPDGDIIVWPDEP